MTMPITEKEYFNLQEYWDYQRKVEYNRELCLAKVKQLWAEHEVDEIFPVVWNKVSTDAYLEKVFLNARLIVICMTLQMSFST